ncbi:MAG: hypothetical protein J6A02_11560 [Prevotella sp.]|nr:hypothetical protein [Prevotella sp.]
MKKLLVTFVLLIISQTIFSQLIGGLTEKLVPKSEAIATVKSYYIGQDVDYYIKATEIGITDDNWIIFVDEEPTKGWAHNCALYTIPKKILGLGYLPVISRLQMPPAGMNFSPLDVKNRYGDNANLKLTVSSSNSVNINQEVAQHTYAVILSGGVNKTVNHVRYWNDCSYIYQTLRNRFQIPKQNIIPIMSDGNNSGADMYDYHTGFCQSSPLDLDFDGSDDLVYAATNTNVTTVLTQLASTLTEDDHLFLFVIDHGGTFDGITDSYICLWNNEILTDATLAQLLDNINVGTMNIVLGQCFSGGFIDNLAKPGRVIATACDGNEYSWACPDIPYDEFVFQWTNALNETNKHTGESINSNTDNNNYISMEEAFIYARDNDRQSETPLFSSVLTSVGEELAFNHVPPSIDLYIRDNIEDTGKTPNLAENTWNSPDICLRTNKDSIQEHQNPIINGEDVVVYINVMVRNRGTQYYSGSGKYLHLYWANASFGLGVNTWKGVVDGTSNQPQGNRIEVKHLTKPLAPGDSAIYVFSWLIPSDLAEEVIAAGGQLHTCLLAVITDNRAQEIESGDGYIPNVGGKNDIAQRNMTIIYAEENSQPEIPLYIRNIYSVDKDFNIEIVPNEKNATLFDESETILKLSQEVYSAWQNGGSQGDDIEQDYSDAKRIKMLDITSKIKNIKLSAKQENKVYFTCNFLADETIDSISEYYVDVIQRDVNTGTIIGGETFKIIKTPRAALTPEISYNFDENDYLLEATGINEDVQYEWFNEDGEKVGEGEKIKVKASAPTKTYTLKVSAKKDGAYNYASISLDRISEIKSISPNPFNDHVKIKFRKATTEIYSIKIALINGAGGNYEYVVNEGQNEFIIDTSKYKKGNYILNLIREGKIIESRQILKK